MKNRQKLKDRKIEIRKKKWRSEKNLKNWNMDENWKLDQNRQYWKNEIVIENWGKKLEIQQKNWQINKIKRMKKMGSSYSKNPKLAQNLIKTTF